MRKVKAKIAISLKEGILDPQGKAVEHSLHSLGFDSVGKVRIGKLIEIELDHQDVEEGKKKIDEMCKKLLSNPVTENYDITIA